MPRYVHCDDLIDDPATPDAARAFLAHARSPAHGMLLPGGRPRLFATYQGRRVQVVMASRMGDVGITSRLDADVRYEGRVWMGELTDLGDRP